MNKKSIKQKLKYAGLIIVFITTGLLLGSSQETSALNITNMYIFEDTTWSPDDNPIVIFYGLYVMKENPWSDAPTLTITTERDNGTHDDVIIKVKQNKFIHIGDDAAILNAQGTSDHRIIFTSYNPPPDPENPPADPQYYWQGITFKDGTDSALTTIKYCTFEYGGLNTQGNFNIAPYLPTLGQVTMCLEPNPVENCIFRKSYTNGIYLDRGKCDFKGCVIENNRQSGIFIKDKTQNPSESNLSNNHIKSNGNNGNGYGLECKESEATLSLDNNTFLNNEGSPVLIPISAFNTQNDYGSTGSIEFLSGSTVTSGTYDFPLLDTPYLLRGSSKTIFSADGTTINVTFDPGVTMKFEPGTGLELSSSGGGQVTFSADGTPNEKIFFLPATEGNSWGGIKITDASSVFFDNCIFDNGGTGQSGSLHCENSNPTIRNCTITNSKSSGIYVWNGSGSTTIDNCTISNSASRGIYAGYISPLSVDNCTIRQNNSDGIKAGSSNATIDNCTIQENGGSGISFSGTGSDQSGTVSDNIISNNQGSGIEFGSNSSPLITGNTITYNNTSAQDDKYGIGCTNFMGSSPTITANEIIDNGPYPVRFPASGSLAENNTISVDNSTLGIEVIGTNISEDRTWYNLGIPYSIPYIIRNGDSGGVAVSNDGVTYTLTIKPGVTIKFDEDLSLRLGQGGVNNFKGSLIADGTKESPITFTTSEPGRYWQGIEFHHQDNVSFRLNYCIVEYGGDGGFYEGNIYCNSSMPGRDANIIQNSTIRYSETNGIIINGSQWDGSINNCNIYGNALYDLALDGGIPAVDLNAELNYWGTPSGPSQDLCSSAVVADKDPDKDRITYEAWLEEEFTDPFRFSNAGASKKSFNPIEEDTTISFSLNGSGPDNETTWTVSILNLQFEKLWSTSGQGSPEPVVWDGAGDYGVVSGKCYYRIEAHSSSGSASPAMGVLILGKDDHAIARISEPASQSVFSMGTDISIKGTASYDNGTSGTYEVLWSDGVNDWELIDNGISNVEEGELALWEGTSGLEGPITSVYIKLLVHGDNITYSDIVSINFYTQDPMPEDNATVRVTTYSYDALGRLKSVGYPNGGGTGDSVNYTYDSVGNRLLVQREVPSVIELSYFQARPSLKGVVIEWQTESEIDTAGYNLYRRMKKENRYEKITSTIVPATGSPTAGKTYSFTDVPPKRGKVQYLLEEVETTGKTTKYGPVSTRNITLRRYMGTKGVMKAFKKSFNVRCE